MTIKAHDVPVRTMVWSNNDNWMITGDHGGYVKYWQSNMNNVKMFQAHKEPIRGIRYTTVILIIRLLLLFFIDLIIKIRNYLNTNPPPHK